MRWIMWAGPDYGYKIKDAHTVMINRRVYNFTSFSEAVAFCNFWNGVLLTPINNP